MVSKVKPKTVDEYIKTFPKPIQARLQQVRRAIKQVIPESEETISYGHPTFKLNGSYVIYFAGYKDYISLYPLSAAMAKNKKEEAMFAHKGTAHLNHAEPLPLDFVTRATRVLLKANQKRVLKK